MSSQNCKLKQQWDTTRKSGILTSSNADEDLEQQEPSFSAGGDTK